MATVEQLRTRLIEKLKELFQLNQPDLDFGFYRIMHAKSDQVIRYLENDLPKLIAEQFDTRGAQLSTAALEEAKASVIRLLGESAILPDGALAEQYANTPVGKDYLTKRSQAALAGDTAAAEAQVYDHLYRFFERYYDDGDFISRRYYASETQTRAAPYALPYSGEEVKLVWANMDQYYIKTTEYFSNFTFDLAKSEQAQAVQTGLFGDDVPAQPYRVHFQIAEATEGEHGNVKASDQTKRFFLIYEADPVTFDDQGELVCRFEYRPDPEKSGQDATWRDKRNGEAVETILDALRALAATDERAKVYLHLLETPAPTDKDPKRPLLAKYVNRYTARNTMDYFIHKYLGAFLRRELDFYIKNEVVRLDDIEQSDAPRAEAYLGQVRILRRIAGKLIDFLAQLEDFQKRLWLKKKFVVEANYCITLDRIIAIEEEAERTWLLEQIAANDAQREEWVRLFAIDKIAASTLGPEYSVPIGIEFLKRYRFLPVDTALDSYSDEVKARILATQTQLDDAAEGLLIHSDNSQALRMLKSRYRKQVQCIHIDPPYNTQTSGFLYPNSYQHSSWVAMMHERIQLGVEYLTSDGSLACHIDENEYERLHLLADSLEIPDAGTIIWDKRNPMNGGRGTARQHEYVIWRTYSDKPLLLPNDNVIAMLNTADQLVKKYGATDEARSRYVAWLNSNKDLSGGEKAYRFLDDQGRVYQSVSLRAPEPRLDRKFHQPLIHPSSQKPCPVPPNGFSRTPDTLQKMIENGDILFGVDETTQPRQKMYLTSDTRRQMPSMIDDARKGRSDLSPLGLEFPYCHPLSLYTVLLSAGAPDPQSIVIDFFAGSGTTGHALIEMNRKEGTLRRYILIEVGDHFFNVLKPRIIKANYAATWRDGLPVTHESGRSSTLRCIRLESYEDCLNNLEFRNDTERKETLAANPDLAEEYLLHYMLDVETASSPSLLNIDGFTDPTAYRLKVKQPGTDVYAWRAVDLLETFNYLLGLRVEHIAAPQTFMAEFERPPDPELPEDQHTRLQLVRGAFRLAPDGPWWFRKVEGWLPKDFKNPDNGQRERVLIVWRKLTGDAEQDNLMLDEWFRKNRIDTKDWEFHTIYVNGSNNLPNLRQEGDSWKVRLLEEDFLRLMWDTEER